MKNEKFSLSQIIEFAKDYNVEEVDIDEETTIEKGMGLWGDDHHEFIGKFAEVFDVQMENYRWYYHTEEEGLNWAEVFFKPPYKKVEQSQISINMLHQIANDGKWPDMYEKPDLANFRPDILMNQIGAVTVVLIFVAFWIRKCTQ